MVASLGQDGIKRKLTRSKDDSNAGSNYGGENDAEIPEAIANIRRHHKQAYSYIAKALNIDETAGMLSVGSQKEIYFTSDLVYI